MTELNIIQILIAVATTVLALITVLFVVISIVLNYHWTRYGARISSIKTIKRIYVGVSAALFSVMIAAYAILL